MPKEWRSVLGHLRDAAVKAHRVSRLSKVFQPPRRIGDLVNGGLGLYGLTLLGEALAILPRFVLIALVAGAVQLITGYVITTDVLVLAVLPLIWSIFGVLGVWGGGWWWREHMGGREPSKRERANFDEAMETLKSRSPIKLVEPSSWFVVDRATPEACVNGRSLCLSRGLLQSGWLEAVLAHELGHLNSSDGRMTAALNRLVLFGGREEQLPEDEDEDRERQTESEPEAQGKRPRSHTAGYVAGRLVGETFDVGYEGEALIERGIRMVWFLIRVTFKGARGGVGVRILGRPWASYWRGREYKADAFAALLGQGPELADFLEIHALAGDRPVPFRWLSEELHPPNELRIDRIEAVLEELEDGAEDGAGEDDAAIEAEQVQLLLTEALEPTASAPDAVAQESEPVKRASKRSDRSRRRQATLDRTRPRRSRTRSIPGRAQPARNRTGQRPGGPAR